jgi:hypothetical protein
MDEFKPLFVVLIVINTIVLAMVRRCRFKPADPPGLKPRWLRKWERPPTDHCFLTLTYGGGPLCTIQRLKATCDEAL